MAKLVLIGFMGSGKTSLAKLLSKRLALPVFELDEMLLAKTEFTSIPELFREKGESYFRDLEAEICAEMSNIKDGLISCGGGVIQRKENMDNLLSLTREHPCIYLQTSFAEIKNRLAQEVNQRPLFQDLNLAEDLYNQRHALYNNYSSLVLSTDGKSLEDLAQEVITKLGLK
jgi:shikimate kinase